MSSSLHPLERKLLAVLSGPRRLPFQTLVRDSAVGEDQARRALQWLSSKDLVKIHESTAVRLEKVGTPSELILMQTLRSNGGGIPLDRLRGMMGSPSEFSSAFGRAKSAGWVRVEGGDAPRVVLAEAEGDAALAALVSAIDRGRGEEELGPSGRELLPDLVKRGLVRRIESRTSEVEITDLGSASAGGPEEDFVDRLTPDALNSGPWNGKRLRPIDVQAKAPTFYPGRRHPVRDFIKEVRETYVSMGFTELQGDSVHPAFWNFDALFIPQDHPGRDMQDTFYLEGLNDARLLRKGVVASVASTHEDGWRTGSRGWGYSWRIEEARRLVLRTHNTVLTVKALSESKERETRVFAVSKVYRNESLDYKHLAEFYQMDGIIVGEGLNVRHLMGFLKEFYKRLGMADVKLWPTFFPYTEPSLEVVGYSKAAGAWIELSGSGVFRPEVTIPLGVRVPVLAWGPGIERLMLMRFGLDDMRALYGADLSWLRKRKELASSTN